MRRLWIALLLPLAVASSSCRTALQAPETVAREQIPSYRRLTPQVAAAGQPSPAALRELREMGFRTVVNLRTANEGAEAERRIVESQGLRYVSVPVTPETLSLADAEAVEKVLADPKSAPVLIHCASSNRVGALWTVLQARKGLPLDQAEAAGREAGLRSPELRAAVRRVLAVAPPGSEPALR